MTDYSSIDVKIQLELPLDKSTGNQATSKRIKAPESFAKLQSTITSFAAKFNLALPIVQIKYADFANRFYTVDDQDDFELGMTQALKMQTKQITFVAEF